MLKWNVQRIMRLINVASSRIVELNNEQKNMLLEKERLDMIGSIRRQMQKRGAKIILWLTLFSLAGGTFITFFKFSSRFNSNSLGRGEW